MGEDRREGDKGALSEEFSAGRNRQIADLRLLSPRIRAEADFNRRLDGTIYPSLECE